MEPTDLRTEFTKETKTRFNTEWLAYNDYVDWLEHRLVKLLTIPPVIPSLLAAGKLALAARLVTTANAKNISQRIENMEAALDAYDNEILSLRNEA